jgi:hypothetical protein
MQDARESLNKVEYSAKDGIQGLYDNIQEHAGSMAMHPDNYMLLSIFINKIPSYIGLELLNTCGLTPEVNTLSEFVANVIDVEQQKKNKDYYKSKRTNSAAYVSKGPKTDGEPRKQVHPINNKAIN